MKAFKTFSLQGFNLLPYRPLCASIRRRRCYIEWLFALFLGGLAASGLQYQRWLDSAENVFKEKKFERTLSHLAPQLMQSKQYASQIALHSQRLAAIAVRASTRAEFSTLLNILGALGQDNANIGITTGITLTGVGYEAGLFEQDKIFHKTSHRIASKEEIKPRGYGTVSGQAKDRTTLNEWVQHLQKIPRLESVEVIQVKRDMQDMEDMNHDLQTSPTPPDKLLFSLRLVLARPSQSSLQPFTLTQPS
jgi:hypothetical protein